MMCILQVQVGLSLLLWLLYVTILFRMLTCRVRGDGFSIVTWDGSDVFLLFFV